MPVIRIAEWQEKEVGVDWPQDVRNAIFELACGWKVAHRLNAPPLKWGGSNGRTLIVRQWVGVLEYGEYRIEIYPKLDAHLLNSTSEPDVSETVADTCLRGLLAMIAAANYGDWVDNGRASLEYEALQFADVWAYLLGKNLSRELRNGVSHAYISCADDLPSVRGRIAVSRQIARNFNRADKIACVWDEWSGDNPLNRLLKCACLFLRSRVSHSISKTVLSECLWLLDEVETISPREALAQTQRFTFSRATARFQDAFELARRLLQSQSPNFGAHSAQNWVFLTDMNTLFEAFCARAIEAKTGHAVEIQMSIGTLFVEPVKKIQQKPDFLWLDGDDWQIGDAKWKLLGQTIPAFLEEGEELNIRKLKTSPDDVRQLTVYSEMLKQLKNLDKAPSTTIFYPTLNTTLSASFYETWNGASLCLCPVRVAGWDSLSDTIGI